MNGIIKLGKTLKMVDDMEVIEKFFGRKGRFFGDMVHTRISNLAECIRKRNARIAELETFIEARGYEVPK